MKNYDQLVGSIKSLDDLRNSFSQKLSFVEKEIALIDLDIDLHTLAISVCEICLKEQASVLTYLETQVTALLRGVFSYDFFFKFGLNMRPDGVSLKGLKPVIGFAGEEDEPEDCADGVLNVISFALRLLFLMFSTKLTNVMVFDEPLVHLNPSKWKHIISFLQEIQKVFTDCQFIFITHSGAEFPMQYTVSMPNTISNVVRKN